MFTDPDFMPFEPPTRPLGVQGIPILWQNYLEAIPRSAYEQGITRIQTPRADVVLACDPDLIGDVLAEKAESFKRDPALRRAMTRVVGENSLFLADGAEWRWQRRAVAPIFRHDMLISFVPTFAAMAERQVEEWRDSKPGVPVDVLPAMHNTSFEIIVETMLGSSAKLDPSERLTRSVTWHLLYVLFSMPEWWSSSTPRWQTPESLMFPQPRMNTLPRDILLHDLERVIGARRLGGSAEPNLLDLLLAARDPESGRSMTDNEVMTNILTFIAAGHETTAVALVWTLWLLAKDQSAQQRVVEEVAAVAGTETITAVHLEGLTYCRQVIQEAMRLFPSAPAIARHPKTAMEFYGLKLTAATHIHIPIFALHRNVLLWDNPNAFDPDRFGADRSKSRSRYAYLPFGAGPRICIGASFATLEALAILATLVRAFRFEAVPGHKPKLVARVTLRPQGGLPLLIVPR